MYASGIVENIHKKIKEKYGDARVLAADDYRSHTAKYQWDFENGRIELSGDNPSRTTTLVYTEKHIEKMKQEWERSNYAREQAEREARAKADI
jgi:hypothetical protein